MSAQNQRADQGLDLFSQTAHHPVLQPSLESQHSLSSPSDGGMSAFPPGRTHLPTPQSPDFMGQYLNFQTPESPLAQASSSYTQYPVLGRPAYGMPLQKQMISMPGASPQQQPPTPETSPYTPRYDPRFSRTPTIPYFNPHSAHYTTPRAVASSTTLPSPATANRSPSRMTTPPPSAPSPALSSPFLDKLTIADKALTPGPQRLPGSTGPTSTQIPVHINDIFSSSAPSPANPLPVQTTPRQIPGGSSSVQISTPPVSPTPGSAPPPLPLVAPSPVPGGEMERIRHAMMQNQIALQQEAEARRPDYLKRAKRPLSETDPPALADDESSRRPGVGIMDSPHKGRRITLFQETSDESFEESLMAGGYGRYRTADWVRQPQPMMQTPGPPGPSTAAKPAEAPQPPRPLTEKELRKRKRLEAFRSNETTNTSSDPHTSKLFPVHLEVLGRVLVDNVSEEHGFAPAVVDPSPSKAGTAAAKRAIAAANRKAKKKSQEPTAREKKLAAAQALEDAASERPNWPDAEFPWRLRSEERAEMTKEEDEQRMDIIEQFLNRDTDEEDGSGEEDGGNQGDNEDLLDQAEWSRIYEAGSQRPIPTRGGRGKMVQLSADPHVPRPVSGVRRTRFFPSDPGDARAALLAKRSVRSLAFRQARRARAQSKDEEEVLCICRGRYDDAGDVVQCDSCQIWYHLHCINVRSIADLGGEDDPWYCRNCYIAERSESSDEEAEARAPEPTFVPTDSQPPPVKSQDTPLFQPTTLQDSPMPWSSPNLLATPPRGSGTLRASADWGSGFSSTSASDTRLVPVTPSTPQNRNRRASGQMFTPGGVFDMDDMPFDPASTPSRGIKFGGITTPKNMWPTRPNVFETPSRRRDSASRLFGAPGTLDESAMAGGVSSSPFGRMPTYDDSPIRRGTAPAGDPQRTRGLRLLESPLAPSVGGGSGRYLGHLMPLEDSPVMWSSSKKGKERAHEAP
ncbi:hypothetical protein DFH06DRAFT_1206870 [Mycena polygramma]|nr:hypothetical protein DFH06DRAFT_1206870 [Mycena polygramma]